MILIIPPCKKRFRLFLFGYASPIISRDLAVCGRSSLLKVSCAEHMALETCGVEPCCSSSLFQSVSEMRLKQVSAPCLVLTTRAVDTYWWQGPMKACVTSSCCWSVLDTVCAVKDNQQMICTSNVWDRNEQAIHILKLLQESWEACKSEENDCKSATIVLQHLLCCLSTASSNKGHYWQRLLIHVCAFLLWWQATPQETRMNGLASATRCTIICCWYHCTNSTACNCAIAHF